MKIFLKIKTRLTKPKLVTLAILLFALGLRVYGLDWDQGQHLHPDERFLTMVANDIKMPKSTNEYLDPQSSPLNPYNAGYNFFVYGTFPLSLAKVVGIATNNNHYGNIHFVGRLLSAVFDLGVVFLIFMIGRKIFSEKTGFLAAFLYSIMVLPIQLSHFFAVDTFLNFFLVLSFYLLVVLVSIPPRNTRQSLATSTILGGTFGLALACKISALYFLPVIGLGFLAPLPGRKTQLAKIFLAGIAFGLTAAVVFRLTQPQAFSTANFLNWQINPQFIKNLKELKDFSNPNSWFPPAVQWKSTTPIIFPLKNLILWGLGLPLGIISFTSLLFTFFKITKTKPLSKILNSKFLIFNSLIILWIFGLFIYQGIQFCKTMRYFLPLYPFLALLSANFLTTTNHYLNQKASHLQRLAISVLFFVALLIYPLSFMNIYTKKATRVAASEWVYENIPPGATLLFEEWDDPLPLNLPGKYSGVYKGEPVFMYDPDTPEKWQRIDTSLKKVDYLILSSNRAYGSTMKLPQYFPETTKYYQSLFSGPSDFKKIAEFTSYPCFPPGKHNLLCFKDDWAEEAFTVYDHPKVMIFKKEAKSRQ